MPMLYKTRGVVFRYTRYGDTSIIVTIFTALFGLQTYIVNGIRSKSAKNKIALYQPLTLLDMVVYHKENVDIHRVKEVRCAYSYNALSADFRKNSIALFLTEILNKAVKEQSHAEELCDFFFEALETLDRLSENIENFHLVFLVRLSRFLGFGPQHISEILMGPSLDEPEEKILQRCLSLEFGEKMTMSHIQRTHVLSALLRFYQRHLDNFGEVRSVQVLREVLE
jgi:DNA repair protein RecO (recombination protein O)